MIAIIDYGMGNVRSVYNALDYLGEEAVITSDKTDIRNASKLILPGVGAFGDAMKNLIDRDLVDILNRQVLEEGKPILGLCLGMQLFAKSSEEYGLHAGLGWVDAKVKKFDIEHMGLKVPHIGWNDISINTSEPLFVGLSQNSTFYFVHSFHMSCADDRDVAAICSYGIDFVAAVQKDNIMATQFHPEKSQDNGIQLLENFINWRN